MALYSKYRPYKLAMVCGQEHVKLILSNQVKNDKVSHAYLLSGPAGTGKTTVARILSAMVNATAGPTVDLSLDDPVVAKIIAGKSGMMDVVEMDAASQRGIDDIRALREKIYLAPMELRKKIYIIDECHQLTPEAWNALLKILEEPPPHAMFIFCTTDAKKVLETIKTRCQCFEFRMLSYVDVLAQCKMVATAEKIEIEEDALRLLAKSARGSPRSAISRLEKLSAMGAVTAKMASQVLGVTSMKTASQFLSTVISRDLNGNREASSDAMSVGVPAADFIALITEVVHAMTMCGLKGYDPEREGHTPEEARDVEILKNQLVEKAGKTGGKVLCQWLETLDRYSKISVLRSQHLMDMAFMAMVMDLKELGTPVPKGG